MTKEQDKSKAKPEAVDEQADALEKMARGEQVGVDKDGQPLPRHPPKQRGPAEIDVWSRRIL